MIEVVLHSYEDSAIEATRDTVISLGGALTVDQDKNAEVHCTPGAEGFIRFALKNQGYVKEVK